MRVLMFGWEFPPHSSGGLGTACYGLTKGLSNQKIEVVFVLPKANSMPEKTHVKLVVADNFENAKNLNIAKNLKIRKINSLLVPYADSGVYKKRYSSYQQYYRSKGIENTIYSQDLYEEVQRYALLAKEIAKEEPHDIIHCHDWILQESRQKKVLEHHWLFMFMQLSLTELLEIQTNLFMKLKKKAWKKQII